MTYSELIKELSLIKWLSDLGVYDAEERRKKALKALRLYKSTEKEIEARNKYMAEKYFKYLDGTLSVQPKSSEEKSK